MTFNSNVQPPKVMRPKPQPWKCCCVAPKKPCGRMYYRQENPGYLVACPACRMRRPD